MTVSDRTALPIAPEAELVLRLCRPNPGADAHERAGWLLEQDLDWGRVIDHATRHRVLPAVWTHVDRFGRRGVPQMHRHLARAAVLYNAQRADALRREFQALRAAFAERQLPTLVRKGIYLAWAVYPDPSWRYMTDLDFLVRRTDLATFKEVMHELGYAQGAVSADHRRVTPISREIEAFWLINASSLPAFLRPTSEPSMRVFHVDLRHHVLEPAMGKRFDLEEWFARSREEWIAGALTRLPSREDFLIDICVHLYREAMTLTTIEAGKDVNLSKYVDVAEVLASTLAAPDRAALVDSVRRYSLGREVYYALHHTEALLPGSVDRALLRALDPGDHAYLDEYGGIDGQPERWPDPIEVRAFDYARRTAVAGRSRLLRSG